MELCFKSFIHFKSWYCKFCTYFC